MDALAFKDLQRQYFKWSIWFCGVKSLVKHGLFGKIISNPNVRILGEGLGGKQGRFEVQALVVRLFGCILRPSRPFPLLDSRTRVLQPPLDPMPKLSPQGFLNGLVRHALRTDAAHHSACAPGEAPRRRAERRRPASDRGVLHPS